MTTEHHSFGPDWDEVIALTAEMEAHIDSGEWEKMVALERRRRERLERFFSQGVPPERADAVAEAIESLMAREKAMIERCEGSKHALVQNLLNLNKSARAVNAYTST